MDARIRGFFFRLYSFGVNVAHCNLQSIIKICVKQISFFVGFNFGDQKNSNNNLSPGKKLCDALQGMGTTFIKLGQFLATRPDIIGENMSKELEKLQDKLPAFGLFESKNILYFGFSNVSICF